MTKEEILAMEAGRELDKAVGEVVFGLEVKIFQGFAPDLCYQYRTPSEYGETHEFLPKYSTDISAAWPVVEKLDIEGFKFYTEPLSKGGFEVGFLPANKLDRTYWRESEEAKERWNELFVIILSLVKFPEAICKAALLAKLKEET